MDLRTIQARWKLERLTTDQLPELATRLLAEGVESPGLIELAGLVRPTYWEAAPVLTRVFEEGVLPPIDRPTALWRLAYGTAREIVDGEIVPREGAATLWDIANELDLPEALRYFVYLAADYGEGPLPPEEEAKWFDAKIVETARELLAAMPADGESPPPAA